MNDEELKTRLAKIFAKTFQNVKEADVIFDGQHEEFEEWDSLNHMNLIASLEEEFGISFDVDDISEADRVSKVFTVVKKLQNKKGDAK